MKLSTKLYFLTTSLKETILAIREIIQTKLRQNCVSKMFKGYIVEKHDSYIAKNL